MKHEIKIAPQYFCRVEDGTKTFEVRNNDRGYQPGDIVVMKEFDKTKLPKDAKTLSEDELKVAYTGREIKKRVGYVLPVDSSRVVFSLLELQ